MRPRDAEFSLVFLLDNDCIIFRTNSCTPTFARPGITRVASPIIGIVVTNVPLRLFFQNCSGILDFPRPGGHLILPSHSRPL